MAKSTKPAGVSPAKKPESVYTVRELTDNYRTFKASKEIVIVALRLAGKEAFTFSEAKKIIDTFSTKEV